jgi:hypothetical protein
MLNPLMKATQDHDHPSHPAGYSRKLKSGLARLRMAVKAEYENAFPGQVDSIEQALAQAETLAWSTPFPSLFFPPLARIELTEIAPFTQPSHS